MTLDSLPTEEQALAGRENKMVLLNKHFVNGNVLQAPFCDHLQQIIFGMGCFWGAEKKFWPLDGVYTTAVGYIAGATPNPTYDEVCSGKTGHNEAVLIVYDATVITTEQLLKIFWESHDPTQGMRQGNDRGTQYRSGIYVSTDDQQDAAEVSHDLFQPLLTKAGYDAITTEILAATKFYYAEDYHQQYLAKNPEGYCGLGGTGVTLD